MNTALKIISAASVLMFLIGALAAVPLSSDAADIGSVSSPVASLEYGTSNHGVDYLLNKTAYVLVGGHVAIESVWVDAERIYNCMSVTSGYGLSISNGLVSGNLSKAGTVVVSVGCYEFGEEFTVSVTIVAVSQTYTVSFNSNGGSSSPAAQSAVKGNGIALSSPGTVSGYSFSGWYTAASGGTRVGGIGDVYVVTSNVTLYAQWTKNVLQITSTHDNAAVVMGNTFEYNVTTNTDCTISTNLTWLTVQDHRIIGTPTEAGTYNVTVTAARANYSADTQSFTITVSDRLTFVSVPTGSILISAA